MNYLKQYLFLLIVWLVSIPLTAQTYKDTLKLNRPIQKVYKFNDNLFWGLSAGVSYPMSEDANGAFFKMIRPHVDFEFGKHLNKWMAARVMLGYHSQCASVPEYVKEQIPDADFYSFSMVSGYADAMFCINRLFSKYNPEERHQFWAFGGIGGMLCFGYSDKIDDWTHVYAVDTSTKIYPAWRVGLEWHWKVSRSTAFVVRGLYATTNIAYNGVKQADGGSRHFAELSIGVNMHLGNRYGQRHFENCGHNANRYFNVMNSRLAKMHEKYNKIKAKTESKKTHTKVRSEISITESDSILLFPVDYFYITDMQKSKLRRMTKYLNEHPDQRAHIHIYPDAGSIGSMELEFRVKNRAERLNEVLTNELKLSNERFIITTHPNEQSPYPPQHIFTLGGIIRYESNF